VIVKKNSDQLKLKNMKKLVLFPIVIAMMFLSKTLVAQDGENNFKNFRFGLIGQPSIAWYKPDNTELMESKGSKLKFAYGLVTDFRLNKVACFSTGIEAHYSGGELGILKDTVIYSYNDDKDTFMLTTRNYRVSYITIPITLKMKSSEIGAFTYFGQFGVDLSIKTKARSITDNGYIWKCPYSLPFTSSEPKKNLDITNDMSLFNIGLNIGAGLEYNLEGTTSILVSVNYHNGFTNVLHSTSDELKKATYNSATQKYIYSDYKQNAISNYVSFSLGILF